MKFNFKATGQFTAGPSGRLGSSRENQKLRRAVDIGGKPGYVNEIVLNKSGPLFGLTKGRDNAERRRRLAFNWRRHAQKLAMAHLL